MAESKSKDVPSFGGTEADIERNKRLVESGFDIKTPHAEDWPIPKEKNFTSVKRTIIDETGEKWKEKYFNLLKVVEILTKDLKDLNGQ